METKKVLKKHKKAELNLREKQAEEEHREE
jgi:hypothetical protein